VYEPWPQPYLANSVSNPPQQAPSDSEEGKPKKSLFGGPVFSMMAAEDEGETKRCGDIAPLVSNQTKASLGPRLTANQIALPNMLPKATLPRLKSVFPMESRWIGKMTREGRLCIWPLTQATRTLLIYY